MEPTWLADSSGVVYARPREKDSIELCHLDVAGKRPSVIATVENCATNPVGVSSKGDRVAVLRQRRADMETVVANVLVYDFAGKLTHESEEYTVKIHSEKSELPWNAITWSPVDNQLLLWGHSIWAGEFPRIYDIDTRKVEVLENCRMPMWVPDGSGLLVHGETLEDEDFFLRTRDGNLQKFTWTKAAREKVERLKGAEKEKRAAEAWESVDVQASPWHGNTLRRDLDDGYFQFDIARREIDFIPSRERQVEKRAAASEGWKTIVPFADPTRRLCVRALPKADATEPDLESLEYIAGGKAKPKNVLPRMATQDKDKSTRPASFHRSPDGKRIAVKYLLETSDAPRLTIIDEDGRIVVDFEL